MHSQCQTANLIFDDEQDGMKFGRKRKNARSCEEHNKGKDLADETKSCRPDSASSRNDVTCLRLDDRISFDVKAQTASEHRRSMIPSGEIIIIDLLNPTPLAIMVGQLPLSSKRGFSPQPHVAFGAL